jgi:Fur family ferric uptake transcriptional regulator
MIDRLEQLCRDQGVRLSRKRLLLLDLLDRADGHLSAEEIWDLALARDRNVSMPTVYRLLSRLVDLGLLSRLELSGRLTRYEKVSDEHHDHLIDVKSKKVVKFRDPKIEHLARRAAARLGYRFVEYRLEVFAEPHTEMDDER